MVSQFCADLVFAQLFGSATCAGFCRTPVKAIAEPAPFFADYVMDPVSVQVQQGLSTTRVLRSAVYLAWGYCMVTHGSLSCKGVLYGYAHLSFLHGRMVTLRCCASHPGKLRNSASQAHGRHSMEDTDGYDAEADESYGGQEGRRRSRGQRGHMDRQEGHGRRSRGNEGDGGSKGRFGLSGGAFNGEFSCTPLNVAQVSS